MEKIKQLIERQREEFKEEFPKLPHYRIFLNEQMDYVKSFHSQSTKDLIDAVVEMEEEKKKGHETIAQLGVYDQGTPEGKLHYQREYGKRDGYNQAIDDTITQLLAIKEML